MQHLLSVIYKIHFLLLTSINHLELELMLSYDDCSCTNVENNKTCVNYRLVRWQTFVLSCNLFAWGSAREPWFFVYTRINHNFMTKICEVILLSQKFRIIKYFPCCTYPHLLYQNERITIYLDKQTNGKETRKM